MNMESAYKYLQDFGGTVGSTMVKIATAIENEWSLKLCQKHVASYSINTKHKLIGLFLATHESLGGT